jgi:hypothetical protein
MRSRHLQCVTLQKALIPLRLFSASFPTACGSCRTLSPAPHSLFSSRRSTTCPARAGSSSACSTLHLSQVTFLLCRVYSLVAGAHFVCAEPHSVQHGPHSRWRSSQRLCSVPHGVGCFQHATQRAADTCCTGPHSPSRIPQTSDRERIYFGTTHILSETDHMPFGAPRPLKWPHRVRCELAVCCPDRQRQGALHKRSVASDNGAERTSIGVGY